MKTATRVPGGFGEQLAFDLPGLPPDTSPPALRVGRRPARPNPAAAPVAPPVVWGVWDGEDLVGVYALEQVARADAAVLRRDAVRAGVRASVIDCVPVPVFAAAQHTGRGAAGSSG